MALSAIAGFMGERQSDGGGARSGVALAVLISFVAIIASLSYAIWLNTQNLKTSGELISNREKLNRNIIMACGVLGGVIGAVLATNELVNTSDNVTNLFSVLFSGPIPAAIALPLVFVWGVIMPVIAWFWHTRAIDEQEASAYRDGGYYAACAFLIFEPTWWLL